MVYQPPSSVPPSSSWWDGPRGVIVIARVVGILCVAGGFILGIQGLEQPETPLLPTALGLIVAGVIAQLVALVKSFSVKSEKNR